MSCRPFDFYQIQNNPHYFHTGHAGNGDQILIGPRLPKLAMLRFDADGNFLGLRVRAIPRDLLHFDGSVIHIDRAILDAFVEKWKTEIELSPGTISIRPFFMIEKRIGIKDLPDSFEELQNHSEELDPETRHDLEDDLQHWLDAGNFVFWWNQDYYLNREGKVVSS